VALPKMQGPLSASQDQMTWVLTSYIIAAAVMTPLAGWLAGRIGRRRLILGSIAAFTVSSMLCGLSQDLPQMVLFRFLQGLAGASLVPMSQAVLLDINPVEKHGRAMSIWAQGVLIGPMLGPLLGGWLTDHYSWRWVFYINFPLGILAFLGVAASLPRGGARHSRFDFLGFALLAIGIGALQLTLDRGPMQDWFESIEIWTEAVLSGLAFYLFWVHSATSRHPFLRPTLFADRNYLTGNVFIFIVGVVVYATMSLLPSLLQGLMGYPVFQAGLLTAPRSLGMMAAMTIAGPLIGRIDPRAMIGCGFGLAAFSIWQMTQIDLSMGGDLVLWSGILQGFGTGLVSVPMSTLAFASLPGDLRNEGSAFFSLVRNIGSCIGISLAQTLLMRNTQVVHASLAAHVSAYNLAARDPQLLHRLSTPAGMAAFNGEVTRQAAVVAYIDDFQLMFVLCLLALPLLLLVKKPRRKVADELPEIAVE
jgi:DHA2 family multidrug resistance protein